MGGFVGRQTKEFARGYNRRVGKSADAAVRKTCVFCACRVGRLAMMQLFICVRDGLITSGELTDSLREPGTIHFFDMQGVVRQPACLVLIEYHTHIFRVD